MTCVINYQYLLNFYYYLCYLLMTFLSKKARNMAIFVEIYLIVYFIECRKKSNMKKYLQKHANL